MKKIEKKKFEAMKALKFDEAQKILGACALMKVELIRYKVIWISNYGSCCFRHEAKCFGYGYIWKSLASDTWVRAEVSESDDVLLYCGYVLENIPDMAIDTRELSREEFNKLFVKCGEGLFVDSPTQLSLKDYLKV